MARKFKMGKTTRSAYGETLVELGAEIPDLIVMDADLSCSTKTAKFGDKYPDRFFNCGIQEANMVAMAAGLASQGRTVFVSSFASFLMCKAFDQMRMCVSYPGNKLKMVSSHGGISIGEDGPSQMAIEDLALACCLPGVVVAVPADEVAARGLVRRAAYHEGPVYLRTGRPTYPLVYGDRDPASFEFGKAVVHHQGSDATIVTNGMLLAEALIARDLLLEEKGLEVTVVDMHTIRPLDRDALCDAARRTGAIVVVEEHLLDGGLGSHIARALAEMHPVPMEFIGLRERYAESGKPRELLERYGLTAPHIVRAAERVLARKRGASVPSLA